MNFVLTDDSKTNLEEEKQILEDELRNIVKIRDEKEKGLMQRDNLQKELNTKQTLVSQKEKNILNVKN